MLKVASPILQRRSSSAALQKPTLQLSRSIRTSHMRTPSSTVPAAPYRFQAVSGCDIDAAAAAAGKNACISVDFEIAGITESATCTMTASDLREAAEEAITIALTLEEGYFMLLDITLTAGMGREGDGGSLTTKTSMPSGTGNETATAIESDATAASGGSDSAERRVVGAGVGLAVGLCTLMLYL